MMKNKAIEYATKKMKIFPMHFPVNGKCSCGKSNCHSIGKHPRTKTGFKEATNDLNKIEQWWISSPNANIGIATGKDSGIVVLDIDPRNGGNESFSKMVEKYGELPKTPTVITGSGGKHYYFKYPSQEIKNRANLAGYTGIDIRGKGGCVVAPPSLHYSGNRYEWMKDYELGEIKLAEMPVWLIELIIQPDKNIRKNKNSVNEKINIPDGERNATLASIAGSLRNRGMEEEEIYEELLLINTRKCSPPLEEKEVRTIAHSIARYQPGTYKHKSSEIYTLSDTGNAKRFVENFGKDMRYCIEMNCWLVWNGKVWIVDKGNIRIMQFAKQNVEKMRMESFKNV